MDSDPTVKALIRIKSLRTYIEVCEKNISLCVQDELLGIDRDPIAGLGEWLRIRDKFKKELRRLEAKYCTTN